MAKGKSIPSSSRLRSVKKASPRKKTADNKPSLERRAPRKTQTKRASNATENRAGNKRKWPWVFGVVQKDAENAIDWLYTFDYRGNEVTAEFQIDRSYYIALKKYDQAFREERVIIGLPFGWGEYTECIKEELIRFLDGNGGPGNVVGTDTVFQPQFRLRFKGSPSQIVTSAINTIYHIEQVDDSSAQVGDLPIPPSQKRALSHARKAIIAEAEQGIYRLRQAEKPTRTYSTNPDAIRKRNQREKAKHRTSNKK